VGSGTHVQSYFVVVTDVLYKVYKSHSGETIKQMHVVVPKTFRELILQIGHDIPFSGQGCFQTLFLIAGNPRRIGDRLV
jgi:hypothetical protein